MNTVQSPSCANLELAGFNAQKAAEETWEALLSAGVFIEGDFIFASGAHATLKADGERLYSKPRQLAVILGHFAAYPCVQEADVLLYVPEGMRQFAVLLGEELDKRVAKARKIEGARYKFEFESEQDDRLANEAEAPFIVEDIVTTLGSIAGMRSLLTTDKPVHSLAMLLRGTVNPEYRAGLVDHYLLEREIPTDKVEFRRRLKEDRLWRIPSSLL